MTRDQRGEPDLPPGPAMELVDLFSQLRQDRPLSVGQIAVKTGLSPGHISDVLRGWKAPSPGTAATVAAALGADGDTATKARHFAEYLAELNRHNRKRTRDADPRAGDGQQPTGPGPTAAVHPAQTVHPAPTAFPGRAPLPERIWFHARATRRMVAVGTSVIAAALIALSTQLVQLTGPGSSLVSGSVVCESARPVASIWIAASTGQSDSGFAHLGPSSGIINFATGPRVTYSFLLHHSGSYSVHVGCGGTASHWDSRNFSPVLSRRVANLRCDDPRGPSTHGAGPPGRCTVAAGS